MSWTKLQTASGTDTTFVSSVTATFSNPLTAGSIILVAWEGDSATAVNKAKPPTDTAGHTYVRVASAINSGSFDLEIWYALNNDTTASNAVTVTDTLAGADGTVIIEEWTYGTSPVRVIDTPGSGSGTSTTASSGSMTTSVDDSLIWAASAAAVGSNAMSVGSGYSNFSQTSTTFSNIAVQSKVAATAGSYSSSMGISSSVSWVSIIVAISPPAPAGPSSATPSVAWLKA